MTWWTRLAIKSLAVAETAGGQTRYRLLETIRQYAADRLAETGNAGPARRRHAEAFLALAERERDLAVLAREHDNFRAALGWSLSEDSETGPRLARALGGFWLARGFLQEGQDWLERALATGPADPRLRADLLRLLGMILVHTDPERAEATLSEGCQIAAAAGLHAVQARIRVQLSEIHTMLGRTGPEALRECEAAAAVLDAEGDLEGLAEAWVVIGLQRLYLGDAPAAAAAFERAVVYADQSGNHHREARCRGLAGRRLPDCPSPSMWLSAGRSDTSKQYPVTRGRRLASSSSLALLYGYAGRFADARAAITPRPVRANQMRSGDRLGHECRPSGSSSR